MQRSPTRGAHADVAQTRSSHGEPDEMSVTNSEVESAMNHRHLKTSLTRPCLNETGVQFLKHCRCICSSCPGWTHRGRLPILKGYASKKIRNLMGEQNRFKDRLMTTNSQGEEHHTNPGAQRNKECPNVLWQL